MTKRIVRPPGWVRPFAGIDLTGQRFGRLVVVKRIASGKNWRPRWECQCDCGNLTNVPTIYLRRGATTSCGCYKRERVREGCHFVHGKTGTQEHRIWLGMLTRCSNPNVKHFENYGGRGIKVCERWKDFTAFLSDMGPRPSKNYSIDRRDPDGDYSPDNCYWATATEQVNNRRCTRFVNYRGKRMALNDAVREAGSVIHYEAAWVRIRGGWPVEKALETRSSRAPSERAATDISRRVREAV